MLQRLGYSISEDKAHLHKFRWSLATKIIDKGFPIE